MHVLFPNVLKKVHLSNIYRTRAIITRGLYTFYPLFEGQKRFFKELIQKILPLCMVSIQKIIMARER